MKEIQIFITTTDDCLGNNFTLTKGTEKFAIKLEADNSGTAVEAYGVYDYTIYDNQLKITKGTYLNDFNNEPNVFIFEFSYSGGIAWTDLWIEFPLESKDRIPLFSENLGLF